ncbi:MAG: hydrogenase maturation protease [Nitrospirota bacterium]
MDQPPSIVVLGVGNLLMGDDGVGVRAVRELVRRYALPPAVRVAEGGAATSRLLDEMGHATHLIAVDAVMGGGPPGAVYRLASDRLPARRPAVSTHGIGLVELLSLMAAIGRPPAARIVGVQPLAVNQIGDELSPPVAAALPGAVAAIVEELRALGVDVTEKEPSHA